MRMIARSRSSKMLCSSAFFFSSIRRNTRFDCDWSSDVCSSDLGTVLQGNTQSDGTFTFPNVLAGPYFATATDPVTQLSGSLTSAITAGVANTATIQLQPAGDRKSVV